MFSNYMTLELAFSESLLLVQNYYLACLFVIYFTALACGVEKGWDTHTHTHTHTHTSTGITTVALLYYRVIEKFLSAVVPKLANKANIVHLIPSQRNFTVTFYNTIGLYYYL
jgi:cytochrome b561